MIHKPDENGFEPHPPLVENQVLEKKQRMTWSPLEIFIGFIIGGALYIILYLFFLYLFLIAGDNIVEHHEAWLPFTVWLSGIVWALPVLNLFYPTFIFYHSRRRSISFAVGGFCGSLVGMLFVLKIIASINHDFPMGLKVFHSS